MYVLEDVQRAFGPVRAVDGVSFSVETGEHVAITGPSGSGKTTLLQLLGALDRPTGGELRLGDESLSGLDDRSLTGLRLRRLGFVFQQFNLVQTLSARANVEAALDPLGLGKRVRRQRALARLEEVGLGGRAHHLPSQLSGGEQQRVAIARALATEPDVLLADEPTGNLDRAAADTVADLLGQLAGERTVVVVTHDPELAARAPRVIRLRDGAVVADVRGAGVIGLRAVELPVGDVDAAERWWSERLGATPGLRFVPGHPPGVTVVLDVVRPREPLTDPWGNRVRFA